MIRENKEEENNQLILINHILKELEIIENKS